MQDSNKFHTVESAVFRDQYNVERIREDGSIDVAVFTGPAGKQMAAEYEQFKNGTSLLPTVIDTHLRFKDEGKSIILNPANVAIVIADVMVPGREIVKVVLVNGIEAAYRGPLALQIAVAYGCELPRLVQ